MQRNPYQPPKAEIEIESLAAVEAGPRPISAWILEVVLAIFIVLVLAGVVRAAVENNNYGNLRILVGLAITVTMCIALSAAFVAAIIAIHRGYKFARWAGLAAIVVLGAIMIFRSDTTSYASDAERSGGVLGRTVLMPALIFWWSYSYAFSRKASEYFIRLRSNKRARDANADA